MRMACGHLKRLIRVTEGVKSLQSPYPPSAELIRIWEEVILKTQTLMVNACFI